MKNLIILLLFLPISCLAQKSYGLRDCHNDLIFGYDYGDQIAYRKGDVSELSTINSFRIGTNLTYPMSTRTALVTGIRVASHWWTSDRKIKVENISSPFTILNTEIGDFYLEIPFSIRRMLKSFNRDSRIYLEGGLQFNFYAVSLFKTQREYQNGDLSEDKRLRRYSQNNDFNLSSQFAIGWEYDLNRDIKLFIQPMARFYFLPNRNDNQFQTYHLGVETGLRF